MVSIIYFILKIAASYGNRIFIYEPEPISLKSNETNKVCPLIIFDIVPQFHPRTTFIQKLAFHWDEDKHSPVHIAAL